MLQLDSTTVQARDIHDAAAVLIVKNIPLRRRKDQIPESHVDKSG